MEMYLFKTTKVRINYICYFYVSGTCVCKDDYVGDSCFVKKSAPLELTDIEGGGECDLADGDDCHDCLQFHTENLLKGFKCRINTVDVCLGYKFRLHCCRIMHGSCLNVQDYTNEGL
jgi:hypothetical protein